MDVSEKQLFRKGAFGKRLAQARTRLQFSQEALAEAVGTTARSISRWEHDLAIPQQYYRERLCDVLQITSEALFGANEEKRQIGTQPVFLWHIPYTRNPYFTGREAVLNQLHEGLHTEHRATLTQPQILTGLGGIGKTQTALEYVHRFRNDYQAVLWVGAETFETLTSDYLALAQLFQLPEKENTDQIILREAIKRWFQTHSNWLLVFDNVEDLALLQTMIPDTDEGHILITTRSQIIGTLGVHMDLPKMDQAEGMLFLLRRAKLLPLNAPLETASAFVQAQAASVVDLLDGLPLALDQAGAYVEETRCTLSAYLERYTTQQKALLSNRGVMSSYHPTSVATTFSLAFQHVERISPAAADLLRVCAFLHAEAIPEELFIQAGEVLSPTLRSLSTPLSLDAAVRELRHFSLLHREPEMRMLSIHRLLQVIILDEMDEAEQKS